METSNNILLVVLDAVRADHVSAYGYDRPTTPTIDQLADDGVLFEHAFSNSNWTGTAHAAMFTGLLPSQSGIYGANQSFSSDIRTLPERLHDAGYRTFAVSAGAHIRRERGYHRGFDTFKETYRIRPSRGFIRTFLTDPSMRRQTAYSLTRGPDKKTLYKFDALKRWIAEDKETPFFAFINAKTAHNPYNPPRPYKSMFCDELNRPRYEFVERLMEALGQQGQQIEGGDIERVRSLSREFPVIGGAFEPTEAEWEIVRAWYDGAIRCMDDRLGDLLGWLDGEGMLEDTCVIVTADHGELFGEHGLEKHNYSAYEPLLHVPLVIKAPGCEGCVRIESQVSLIDLFPTLLEFADIRPPKSDVAASLIPFDDGKYHEYTFAEIGRKPAKPIRRHHPEFDASEYGVPTQVVRNDTYKLIRTGNNDRELFEWKDDPDEERDLSCERQDIVEQLESVLEETLGPLIDEERRETVDDPRLKRQLEDLGYL